MKRLNIGLLGGTFNPPHQGHLYISTETMKKIGLDYIWWVVAKQNPLKEQQNNMENRVKLATQISQSYSKIRVIDIERAIKKSYSYNIATLLKQRFPYINFIWIMGSDNLTSLHKWYKWREFCMMIPIAILERGKIYREIKCPFTNYFSLYHIKNPRLLLSHSFGWSVIRAKVNPMSSSVIRGSIVSST